jgi:hypothetical protein
MSSDPPSNPPRDRVFGVQLDTPVTTIAAVASPVGDDVESMLMLMVMLLQMEI